MNFSRNQQETSPNINPVSGSSSLQEQGIMGDFSLDMKLGQAVDLGNMSLDSLKVPSGSKMALSPPSGLSKRARVDFSLDLKLGQAVDLGNETLDSLKVPSGSKMVFSPPSGSSKREHAVNTGIQISLCQVDDCNVDLSCSKDYHRRHKVCELHSKSARVIIGGHKQRFCQQCSRFHLLEEFDDGKRSCRRRLAGHNRRRNISDVVRPLLVNNQLRHPSSLITDASYSSSSALPGYEVSKKDSKDDASQLLNADDLYHDAAQFLNADALYSSSLAISGYVVPKEDSKDDASQLLNADASYCSSLSLPGYEVPKEDSNDDASQLINAYASNSLSSSLPGYEVFLSFSGSDTCLAFANSLYTALNGVGVQIFRDIEDPHKGEEIVMGEIMEAIMESKISIPIFSKKYASSEKCLWELTEMVYCRRSMGQLILPIFYDVEPSDVKHQSGSYENAFHKHAKLFDERAVKEWKEALWKVGELEGWDLNKELSWHGGENFIKENIVPTVLLELKKNYMNNMVVTDYLVGMDYHVNEMMRSLKVDSNEVRIVGIHGISGIGKTTIAKFIYNMLLECFECCSFLADVREMVQQNKDVVSLQKQLLADILKRCPDITDVDSGIDVIKNIVIKKKVLIILDDLDESSHFARLVGKRDWFGSGSRIIIITEDRHVLDDLKVDATYEPLVMDSEQSVQLFSMHAFRRKFPPIDYYSISKEVASTVAGIPLALEVVGSFLSSMEKEVWEDTLKKLEKISHDEVEKMLRVIYEALNYAQQQIFLDIACLFTGMDKETVFYMWDDCGYHPEKELNVLCLMSLVKVGDANELRMHHQLRALGKKIVNEEKIRGNRSRLWNHEDALAIFEGRRGTEKVEALSLHFELGPEKKPRFTGKEFTKLVNLRYLRVEGTNLVGDFEHLLPQLRWLDWHRCSSHFKPTNFHLKNLVILDLSDSGITEDWGGWNQIKMAKKLKVLQLANCALRRTPDFSSYAALEILILRRCRSLVQVDRSIGNLKNLKVLDISYSDIRNLPDEIWMLEKLEVLDFTHCGYLEGHIPSNMGSLTSLRFLSFYDTKIQSLPTSILELSCLQTLKLGGCTELQSQPQLPSSLRSLDVACIPNETNLVNLLELHFVGGCENVEIPRDIWKFSKLEKLTLDYTNIRTLPEEISALSQLKVLDVQFCHDLRCILGLPSSLVVISLAFCYSLERLPNLSNLKILVKLSLRSCIKLTEVQGLGNLESLIWLDIYACDMLANLDLLDQSPCYRPWRRSLYRNMKAKRREKGIR